MLGSSNQLTNQDYQSSTLDKLKFFSPNSQKLSPHSIIAGYYKVIRPFNIDKSVVAYLVHDQRDQEDSIYILELVVCSSESINQELCQEKIKWLQKLSTHVQIPKLYDYIIDNNHCYLIYEHLEGETLDSLLHQKSLNELEIVSLLQDLGRIYDFLIKGSILNYNFLPHNFIRNNVNGRYILSNFRGLFSVKKSFYSLTQKQQQLLWAHHLKICSSFLIQLLCGQYSSRQIHNQNLAVDWKKRIKLSPHVQRILEKMITNDKSDRFNSFQEIMHDCQPLLKIQQTIGDKYRLIRYLGDQNNLKTYIARDAEHQHPGSVFLIVKQINVAEDNPEVFSEKIEKVKLEVHRIQKSNLIPIIELAQEINDDKQELYLVRGYCQGASLTKKLAQNPDFTLTEILKLLSDSLHSLVQLHKHNLIHQNIKPSNLIIADKGDSITFVDMGILNTFQNNKNIAQNIDSYKPPEQIIGRPTQSSDIYALGMVIIQIIRNLACPDNCSSATFNRLGWQEKLKISSSEWLIQILEKMVHIDIEYRYQSSQEVVRDLQRKSIDQLESPVTKKENFILNIINSSWFSLKSLLGWHRNTLAIFTLLLCSLGALEFMIPTLRPKYWNSQGHQNLSAAKPKQALANFKTALNLKPHKQEALIGKAKALTDLRQFAPALSIYQQMLAKNQNNVASLIGLGNIHFELGDYPQALSSYDRVLRNQPDHFQALARKGKILYSLSRYQEAFDIQKKALANNSTLDVTILSDSANTALALGKNHRALNQFTRVENITPLQPYLWQDKVRALHNLGRFEDALANSHKVLESYEQALKQQPKNLQLRLGQGRFFLGLQQDGMANKAYEEAIAIEPNSYAAWLGLSEVFLKNQKYNEALEAIAKAIVLNADSFQAWHTQGLILHQGQQNFEQALVSYNQAIKLNKYFFPAWRDRADTLIAQNKYIQGIKSLNKAVKIAPQDLTSWLNLSVAFQKVLELDSSINALNRAIVLQPRNSEHWLQKGYLVESQKKFTQACDIYRQAMKVAPDFKITEAINKLECNADE